MMTAGSSIRIDESLGFEHLVVYDSRISAPAE